MVLDWKNKVISNFDKKSPQYDQNCVVQNRIAKNLAHDLPKSDGIYEILEIGCGTGNLTAHLLERYKGKNFCITDISKSMLKHAQEKFTVQDNIKWQIMDGENPDTSHKYDLIVANMVFQWFDDFDKALDILRGLLNPNGYIFYTIPGPESFREWKDSLEQLSLPVGILDFPMPDSIYMKESTVQNYDNALDFLRSIKGVGAGTSKKDYAALSPIDIKKACDLLDKNYSGRVTWQALYGKITPPSEEE